ncbi:unnamed protein product [Lymnaea stagnalis]|uniref:Uncharacterized protein n=1 Tax=Lymnaea stagnalis TaxID=6523 RepID=A0AAV2IF21_LYMST
MYYNNGWPNPGIPQATAPIRPPQAKEKQIISITNPESGRNVTDEIITEEQSEGSEKCSGVHPIKTLLAGGKTNISRDVTSQILETHDRSLKKAVKSQASHRSGLTNCVYKKPFLTFDNDKSKLLELRFCFEALKKPTGLPDFEIVLDEPNIGPQRQKRKTKPEFPESFFEQPAERWMEQGYIDLKKL